VIGVASFSLFDTPFGEAAAAWTDLGITDLLLSEGSPEATRARLCSVAPTAIEAAPPPEIRDAMDRVAAHLAGEAVDLRPVVLDLRDHAAFHREAWALAREIPRGVTTTYGALAHALQRPGGARAVGQAMARNPCLLVIPCHRVLSANGALCGFSAAGGLGMKARLLALEAAPKQQALFRDLAS
jgi:methylated-DNA-[protein]-cysteine S-methyltransferase